MAFSKIVGLEVTPVTASSRTIRSNSPEVRRLRRIVSSQIETPASCSCCSRFTRAPISDRGRHSKDHSPTSRRSGVRTLLGQLGELAQDRAEAVVPPIAQPSVQAGLDRGQGPASLGPLPQPPRG